MQRNRKKRRPRQPNLRHKVLLRQAQIQAAVFRKRRHRKVRLQRRQRECIENLFSVQDRARTWFPAVSKNTVLMCPSHLSFEDSAVAGETLMFFRHLHASITRSRFRNVTIDHRPLSKITPPAIIALLAHTHHAMAMKPKVRLSALLPTNDVVHQLLHESGYLKYYSIPDIPTSIPHFTGVLGHVTGRGLKKEIIAEFVRGWPVIEFVERARLYEALIEAATNADEWAYPKSSGYRNWWLLAFRKPSSSEIAFCFLDLGKGIPSTIRTRFKDNVWLIKPSDSELICRAVMEGSYSRTKRKNRGTGLPTLKRLIDHAADGEMLVISESSLFRYRKNQPPLAHEMRAESCLPGTLIAWSIRKR